MKYSKLLTISGDNISVAGRAAALLQEFPISDAVQPALELAGIAGKAGQLAIGLQKGILGQVVG